MEFESLAHHGRMLTWLRKEHRLSRKKAAIILDLPVKVIIRMEAQSKIYSHEMYTSVIWLLLIRLDRVNKQVRLVSEADLIRMEQKLLIEVKSLKAPGPKSWFQNVIGKVF